MAQVNKADPLPYSRTFQVDTYAVVKVHFWPNQQHGMHAAIITNHGCWIADLASNPGAKPSESIFPMSLLVHASCIHATTIHILDDISIHESMCTGVTCLNGIFWRAALLQCSSYMYVMSLLTMLAVTFCQLHSPELSWPSRWSAVFAVCMSTCCMVINMSQY